jgi:hypothetical protein
MTVITPISQDVQGRQSNVSLNKTKERNIDMQHVIMLANNRTKSQAKKYRTGMKKLIENAKFMEGMFVMNKSISLIVNKEKKVYIYCEQHIYK